MDLLDDTLHSNRINFSGLHNLKAAVSIVLIVTGTAQSCSNASMNVGVVGEQAFLGSMVEVCAVVYASNFTWRSSEDLGLPCVEMGVEVDHRNRTVSTVD